MKKAILAICILISFTAKGQFAYEIGGGVGAANYLGEIGGYDTPKGFISDMQFSQTRPGFTGFIRYEIFPWLSINAGLAHGWIQAADSLSINKFRFSRNLSFRNQLFEGYARAEFNYLSLNDIGGRGRFGVDLKMYAFVGGAGLWHSPKAYYNGEWVSLRPLQTEGVAYSRVQFSVPLGGGMHVTFFRRHRIGWDVGFRYTFTDYIDDVSSNYPDPNSFDNAIARALSDRSIEVDPDDPKFVGAEYFGSGTASNPNQPSPRGNVNTRDYYAMSYFTYSFLFNTKSYSSNNNFSKAKYRYILKKSRVRKSRAKF